MNEYLADKAAQHRSLLPNHRREQLEHLRVSCIRVRCGEVFHKSLQRGQEVCIEVCVVLLAFNVSLQKLEDVTTQDFHGSQHRIA